MVPVIFVCGIAYYQRHYGLTAVGLHTVFRAVVVSRLIYAAPAWSGFITATDRQRADAFLHRSKRCGFCPTDLPEFHELLEECDDELFNKTMNNPHHTLQSLFPPIHGNATLSTRQRAHDRQLPAHYGYLFDCNFITRRLYTDIY